MSHTTHKLHASTDEHGTMQSYIIGFILSLIFTAIPYYVVVNKVFSGTSLLVIILGIAFIQMAIQIFFFLHLGRGPKPFYNVVFFAFTFVIIIVVVAGSIFIMNNLQYNMSPSDITKKLAQAESIAQVGGEQTGACQSIRTRHRVILQNGVASPLVTKAQLCDSLTFINEDPVMREITFGTHPAHESYGGETEVKVRNGYNRTITLNQLGTYQFHDHLKPSLNGTFTVSQ